MQKMSESEVKAMLAKGIPKISNDLNVVKLLKLLVHELPDMPDDKLEHQYRYITSAIMAVITHIQKREHRPLTAEETVQLIMLAFTVGRLRSENMPFLVKFKNTAIKQFGRLQFSDVQEELKSSQDYESKSESSEPAQPDISSLPPELQRLVEFLGYKVHIVTL